MSQSNKKKNVRRRKQGIVVSDKMDKTVVVAITNSVAHPRYFKKYKVTRRFKADDQKNEYKVGDKVVIEECRPLSREKRWRVVKKVTRNQ